MSVFATESGADEIATLTQKVLECLNPVQSTDHILHQLWLELQWVKTTVRQGKVIVPNSFQMVLFQAAEGQHSILSKYPILKQRIEALAAALQPIMER